MVEPVPKPRPATTEPLAEPPALYVYRDVLEEVRFNGRWRHDRAAGGLIVGVPHRDPMDATRTYAEVEGYIAGTHIVDVVEFTRYLRMQWKAATAALRYHFPHAQLVGWYVAWPEAGRAPGQPEVVLHNTFFNHPWQAGLWLAGDAPPRAVRAVGDELVESPVGIIRNGS